ncbi:MAG: biotin--[acetyl-CoA-carboxylase] ligase [Cytophagaceae bacterium]|jgi:BirA family biotin operon repressor/biotin-[acetyl-CoA-carboxylase] ligase|nr:biotin--[acetyl-CoA-carboxylase] ligase [Cytophagaceae bacterium]
MQLAHQQALEGTVVITDCQTAGQGQRGNQWEAEPGKNLTFSFLLKPAFLSINEQFLLSKLCSLAIVSTLKSMNVQNTTIKWPNDVYIGYKKTAGILIQNILSGTQWQYSVVGIGLNVNQHLFATAKATSAGLATQRDFVLSEVLNSLLQQIEYFYRLIQKDKTALNQAYWLQLFLLEETHTYTHVLNGDFTGKILGTHDDGRLQMLTDTGIEFFDIKEIIFPSFS